MRGNNDDLGDVDQHGGWIEYEGIGDESGELALGNLRQRGRYCGGLGLKFTVEVDDVIFDEMLFLSGRESTFQLMQVQ